MKENTFKNGDRVRCIKAAYGVEIGELGTVCYDRSKCDVGIRWDIKKMNQRHDCAGACDNGHGLWHYLNHVEHYYEEEDIDDISADDIAAFFIAGGF